MSKFIYSEKATKFCKIFTLLLTVCTVVKSKGKISQNFVAFSEYYMNFKHHLCLQILYIHLNSKKNRNVFWITLISMQNLHKNFLPSVFQTLQTNVISNNNFFDSNDFFLYTSPSKQYNNLILAHCTGYCTNYSFSLSILTRNFRARVIICKLALSV